MPDIARFIFIAHPLLYGAMAPSYVAQHHLGVFVHWEAQVKRTSLDSIAALPRDKTFVIQLGGGSDALVNASLARLGAARTLCLKPVAGSFQHVYDSYAASVKAHLAQHSLSFDPWTAAIEFWGESFEGCVPGYGTGVANALGLANPGLMRYDHTLSDSRFMYGAEHTQTLTLAGSDVVAIFFRMHDNTSAVAFQPRAVPFWLDTRAIVLTLDPNTTYAMSKRGYTLWPTSPPDAKGRYPPGAPTELVFCIMHDTTTGQTGGPGDNGITYVRSELTPAELAASIAATARVQGGGARCSGAPQEAAAWSIGG